MPGDDCEACILPEKHAYYPGNAKWWQKVLGMVPKTNLVRELGKAHKVTLQNMAHTACMVNIPGPFSDEPA